MMTKQFTCFEWDKITDLTSEQLSLLEKWKSTYRHKNNSGDADADAIIQFGRVDGKTYVTFTKYVGILSFKDGLVIEVLPKLFRKDDKQIVSVKTEKMSSEDDDAKKYARALVLTMLRACRQVKNKHFQKAYLNACKLPLLEIFIRMFIDDVNELVRKGLRCGYEIVERNESFFKGKLKISEHILYNNAHRERCYIEYDEFSVNRLENQLIKSTLVYLSRVSTDSQNRMGLNKLLDLFEDVELSLDFDTDIAKYHRDRNMSEYDDIMVWCRLFMEKRSFSIYKGNSIAFALMYPMEKLYETYIAKRLQNILPHDWSIQTQEHQTQEQNLYLFELPKKFKLKPDIVIRSNKDHVWILDTKWKVLNEDNNYGINQGDMYQMYAYYHRYRKNHQNIQSVVLLYPSSTLEEKTPRKYEYKEDCSENSDCSKNSAKIEVFKINLYEKSENLDSKKSELDKIDAFVEEQLEDWLKNRGQKDTKPPLSNETGR